MNFRWLIMALLLLPALAWGQASSTSSKQNPRRPIDTNADERRPARAQPVNAAEQAPPANRIVEEDDVERNLRQGDAVEVTRPEDLFDTKGKPASNVQWFGHAFVYVISSTGVRVAIDPYAKGSVSYAFPKRLPADLVLVSNESDDHSFAEGFVGSPQVFRSVYAVGLNRANGNLFKGVEIFKERRQGSGTSKATGFTFEFDGVRYAHLGAIGDTLNSSQRRDIGRVDVVFLGIGNKDIAVKDLERIVKDLDAKVVVPIKYQTDKTPRHRLRSLDEYLAEQSLPVRNVQANEFKINRDLLPKEPMVYVLAPPAG